MEPDCAITPQSPFPCITRDPNFIPAHNTSATCVCADTYVGVDCADTIAQMIIREEQAKSADQGSGCFALDSKVQLVDEHGRSVTRRLGDVQVGDRLASMGKSGHVSSSPVIFIHDHVHESSTVILHFQDRTGAQARYQLTGAHAVPTAFTCHNRQCKITRTRPASEIAVGSFILGTKLGTHKNEGGVSFERVKVTDKTRGHAMVRYVVMADDTLIVDQVLSVDFSTSAGSLETLPFRMVHSCLPSVLSHPAVAAAIASVLESPLLRSFESWVNFVADSTTLLEQFGFKEERFAHETAGTGALNYPAS